MRQYLYYGRGCGKSQALKDAINRFCRKYPAARPAIMTCAKMGLLQEPAPSTEEFYAAFRQEIRPIPYGQPVSFTNDEIEYMQRITDEIWKSFGMVAQPEQPPLTVNALKIQLAHNGYLYIKILEDFGLVEPEPSRSKSLTPAQRLNPLVQLDERLRKK